MLTGSGDGDGVPGLTVWPHTPAEQTHASNQAKLLYYSYVPVNWDPSGTVTARTTCVATASRAIFHLTGKLDSCTSTSIQMSGTVINDETDVRVYDCRQASNSGASYTCNAADWTSANQPACTSAEVDLLDAQNPMPTTTATFTLVKLGALSATNIDCPYVRTHLP